ncbi:DDB1- and CUL4-associated factor 8 [Phlebotomus argentipes]|uniref:DDB1- and CUL4-associated factor 8 n=1 Tax=Phlebotomus argentipes TaxID=94469 RepID=UPI0028932DFA|nr:DDB1- and CUL4-associated factor 8 [Phlebotomus argentipes]
MDEESKSGESPFAEDMADSQSAKRTRLSDTDADKEPSQAGNSHSAFAAFEGARSSQMDSSSEANDAGEASTSTAVSSMSSSSKITAVPTSEDSGRCASGSGTSTAATGAESRPAKSPTVAKTKHANRNYRSSKFRSFVGSFCSPTPSTSDDDDEGTTTFRQRLTERKERRERESTPQRDSLMDVDGLSSDERPESVRTNVSRSSSSSPSLFTSSLLQPSDYSDNNDAYSSQSSVQSHEYNAVGNKAEFLSWPKPPHTWCSLPELMYRQQGLTGRGRRTMAGRSTHMFERRFGGSRHAVERLELMVKLNEHEGCVNSLNFNRSGNLLVSGSDDLKIILWKWASQEQHDFIFDSGHTSNVFQTKFMELGNVHIISSARDGTVRHHEVPPGSDKPISTQLIKHLGPVHKVALPATAPFEVLSAGEDGNVIRCDLRESNKRERIVTIKVNNRRVPLYSISSHPIDQEFCVSGRDQYVRVYDKRNVKNALKILSPEHLVSKKPFTIYITCAVYNWVGTEILASYSDDDVYLFDNKYQTPGSYLHKYQGHDNSSTIKGVNFFGPRSEFVMSGSDCGNCFFWDKNTETIVQWMPADEAGVVNVLEPHPTFPILATSGLDHDVKIWMPSNENEPKLEGLKKCVHRNLTCRTVVGEDIFDDRMITFFVRQCLRNRRERDPNYCPNVAELVSSSDSDDDMDNMDNMGGDMDPDNLRSLPCAPS